MLQADLYEGAVSLESYLSMGDCRACGFDNRRDFLSQLKQGHLRPDGCRMSKARFQALQWAARPETILPPIEVLQMPNPGPCGLYPINTPGERSPVLVSGNSQLTIEVLSALFATTTSSFWYVVVDTQGHTVDMALIYKAFRIETILAAFEEHGMSAKASKATVFLPGLAKDLCEELGQTLSVPVAIGPVCAAELPLFFGEEHWRISREDA